MEKHDLSSKTLNDLVEIVENPDDYLDFMIKLASKELKKRKHSKSELKSIAENIYQAKCKKLFEGSLFTFDQVSLPYSSILDKKSRKRVFQDELKRFMDKRQMMNHGLSGYGTSGV